MSQHNVYFNGKVQSLSLDTEEGEATVGVMKPGEYTFSTAKEEKMVVTSGALMVKLPGAEWKTFEANQSFIVKENSSFDVQVKADASYLCFYK